MPTVLVAGSKDGRGKDTIASSLAAHYELEGKRTVRWRKRTWGAVTRAGYRERRRPFLSSISGEQ